MRMSNYLGVWTEKTTVMSATNSSFGIRHLTVVPTNFEPTAEAEADGESGADEGATDDARADE